MLCREAGGRSHLPTCQSVPRGGGSLSSGGFQLGLDHWKVLSVEGWGELQPSRKWNQLIPVPREWSLLFSPRHWERGEFSVVLFAAAAAAKSLQSCLTLCDPTGGSPPGSPIPGILQARTLEWVAISFSSA